MKLTHCIDVRTKNFFEFRRLLKIAYTKGYQGFSGKKPGAVNLWFGFDWFECDGISFYPQNKLKFIEKRLKIDTITFNEYLNEITSI